MRHCLPFAPTGTLLPGALLPPGPTLVTHSSPAVSSLSSAPCPLCFSSIRLPTFLKGHRLQCASASSSSPSECRIISFGTASSFTQCAESNPCSCPHCCHFSPRFLPLHGSQDQPFSTAVRMSSGPRQGVPLLFEAAGGFPSLGIKSQALPMCPEPSALVRAPCFPDRRLGIRLFDTSFT